MAKAVLPPSTRLRWKAQYRIVPTQYPPIDLFERTDLTERGKRALIVALRRVEPAVGDLDRVRSGDLISGPNASIVMAPFLHARFPTRFSDGTGGVYYAARQLETAIRETVYHTEREAVMSQLNPQAFHRRVYIGRVVKPFYDVRAPRYQDLNRPDDYGAAQTFTRQLLGVNPDAWGIVYRSVRHPSGDCIAALRPPAVSLPVQGPHLFYTWNGSKITHVFEQSEPLLVF